MVFMILLFKYYKVYIIFECLKVVVFVWNGGIFFFDVLLWKMDVKKKRKFVFIVEVVVVLVFFNIIGLFIEGVLVFDLFFLFGRDILKLEELKIVDSEYFCFLCKKLSFIDFNDVDVYESFDG